MTKNAINTKTKFNIIECSINLKALIGPTSPIIPKPADSFVPPIPINPPTKPVISALVKIGNNIIGCLTIFGIIILTPPKNIVSGTPALFILSVPATNAPSHATIPSEAEPAAKPLIPIAKAVATVEIGEIIIKLNTNAMSIDIRTGCNSVKEFTKFPIPVVIIWIYGKVNTPITLAMTPTMVGKIINVRLPNFSPTNNIKNTAIAAVSIVLIKSPTPTNNHTPSLNCAAPLPTNAELATTAVANGLSLKRMAIKAPTNKGTVN